MVSSNIADTATASSSPLKPAAHSDFLRVATVVKYKHLIVNFWVVI